MKLYPVLLCWVLVWGLAPAGMAADPVRVEAKGGCPSILHTPTVSVMRGTPAVITAKIECPAGSLTDVLLQLRITDAGKPTPIQMSGDGGGAYQAVVPVSMIQGLTRFWYYIDAKGRKGGEDTVAQTVWSPVNIIEHAEMSGSGGAAAGGSGGEGGGAALGGKKGLLWLARGAALVGGGVLLENHNDGGSGGGSPPAPTNSPPPRRDDDDDDDEDKPSPAPPCVTTGGESFDLDSTSPCETIDINVYACGHCTNATIRVTTTWGADVSSSPQPARSCPTEIVTLTVPKPIGFPAGVGVETISVYANGVLIGSVPWPNETEYFDCL